MVFLLRGNVLVRVVLPLAWTWYQWNVRYRQEVQMTTTPANSAEQKSGIEMGSLIGSWNVMGSLATGGARVRFSCGEGNPHSSLSFVVGCCNARFK